jgi:CubicO group peptidase (beta-lactamase class C family)
MRELFVSAAFALLAHCGPANGFSWDALKEHAALQRMAQFQATTHVPSLAVSAIIDGTVVLSKAIAADGSVIPDGQNTRYHIGSLTKQFTAAAVLALIEDGTIVPSTGLSLTLDTTIGELAPVMRSGFRFDFVLGNGSDERALGTFGTGVWERGYRSGRSRRCEVAAVSEPSERELRSSGSTGSNAVSPIAGGSESD